MKEKTLLIIIGIFLLVYYTQQVPYCVPLSIDYSAKEQIPTEYLEPEIIETSKKIEDRGFIIVHTIGESMLPSIRPNSKCVCQRKKNYEIGDIVLYYMESEDGFIGIAHRIVAEDGDTVYTKGDNNNFIETIREENIMCYIPELPRYQIVGK